MPVPAPLTRMLVTGLLAATSLSACASVTNDRPTSTTDIIGRHKVRTLALPPGIAATSATYTPSGMVLLTYREPADTDPRLVRLAIMKDDGSAFRPIFSQSLPVRPKDNGIRYMVFPDNRRIWTGDFVIECAQKLDDCQQPSLYPVEFPVQVAGGSHVAHSWSEPIIAPDNRHIAWTSLLANFSALVFLGELQRDGGHYVIVRPQIISTVDPFDPDPAHPDGVLPKPVLGGEVKQFIEGGSAISMVGAINRDLPDSVIQYLGKATKASITDTPGYTETTILSPDERLGITMTTRFSTESDLAVLGLMPRPYPDSLNMGLSMFAYTHSVTGVRLGRPGNIGPALIDIARSRSATGDPAINLSTEKDWIYYSPMSWHPAGQKAMWVEGKAGSKEQRIQIVELPDYRPAPPIPAQPTPDMIPQASADLSIIPGLVTKTHNINVKVYGRASGHIIYRRTAGHIEKIYVDFSDDAKHVYSGRETVEANPAGNSTYIADVKLTGKIAGRMDLRMTFGPLGGPTPAKILFGPDAAGKPLTRGYTEYGHERRSVDMLVP